MSLQNRKHHALARELELADLRDEDGNRLSWAVFPAYKERLERLFRLVAAGGKLSRDWPTPDEFKAQITELLFLCKQADPNAESPVWRTAAAHLKRADDLAEQALSN